MDGERPINPFLRGNFAPVRTEDDFDLIIEGALPADLAGTFYRTGPNPQFEPRDPNYHWFSGDGMIHAFQVEGGKVRYRNRYVKTPKWQRENAAGEALFGTFGNPMTTDPAVFGTDSGVANTNVMMHAGRLLALEEAHPPFEVTADGIEPVGYVEAGGKVTAHPKIDPRTGEMVFFAYNDDPMPFSTKVSWGVMGADGQLKRREMFEAPYSSMIHDCALSDNYLAIPVMPLSGSLPRAMAGKPPFAWEPELGARMAIIDREKGVESLRWVTLPTGYVFHFMNAWEEGEELVIDSMRYDVAPLFPMADGSPGVQNGAVLVRWRVNPKTGDAVEETKLDDHAGEFPRFDERWAQKPYRHGWFAGAAKRPGDVRGDSLVHVDLQTGERTVWTEEHLGGVGEPIFVPAGETEGDGYLLCAIHKLDTDTGELVVFRATDLAAGPIARAKVPRRVPFGFHANWVGA